MKIIQRQKARNNHNKFSDGELNALILKAQGGCLDSRNEIIIRNVGLILKFIGQHSGRDYDVTWQEDYFQEGVIGMIRAIELFDVSRGLAFSTYAAWWIKQKAGRFMQDNRSLIRVPVYARGIRMAYARLCDKHPQMEKQDICKIVAEELKYPVCNIAEIVGLEFHFNSIHQSVADDEGDHEYQLANDDHSDIKSLEMLDVDYLLTQLSFQEYRVVSMRLKGATYAEIGTQEGFSREWIRKIADEAILKMRTIHNFRQP